MRRNVFLFFVLLPFLGFTQGKKFFQLNYKGNPNFKEYSHFLRDSVWRFNQTLAYDEPNTFDEESWSRLTIEIADTTSFRLNKTIDLTGDCSAAKFYFAAWNVWNHNKDSTTISGQVQLVAMTNEGVSLKLNLIVTSLKTNNQYVYSGERTFAKKATVQEFYDY